MRNAMESIARSVKEQASGAWQTLPLGEVFQPDRPRVSPVEKPNLPFIGMEHVEAHTMKLLGTVPASTMKSSSVHFQPGDVLYGRLRPYLNKVYRPDFEGLCSAEFIVFPNTPDIDTKYLQYFLNSYDFVSFATHLNEGDRPRVDFKQIAPYPFPLAPLPEQRRIVSAIELQLGRLDAAVAQLHTAKAKLKRYKQAVLKAAYDQFEKRPLEELASVITKGASPSWQGVKYVNDTTQTLFVTSENVREGYLDLSEPKYVENSFNQLQKRSVLKNGDVLLNIVGASIGRAAIYDRDDLANTNQAVCLIRVTDELDNGFLCNYLNSEEAKTYYSRNQVDVARANLSLKDVRELPVPYVPVKEQRTFSLKIDQDLATANGMETTLDAQLLQSTRLRQAVLKRAFEGRLIT